MVAISKYPHSAVINCKESGYNESTGVYSDTDLEAIELDRCRFEYQGNKYLYVPHGDKVFYDYILYAPSFQQDYTDNGTVYWNERQMTLNIKHIEVYNQHVKIWLNS
ncbi:MAG: hypothetical protein ACOC4Y_00395 [bacterium]